MLAETEDLNVLDDDHLVVALLEDGVVHDVADILLVALGEKEHRLSVASGGVKDTGAVDVLADALENGANGALELVQPLSSLFGALLESLAGADACPEGLKSVNGRRGVRTWGDSLGRLRPSKSMTGLGERVTVPSALCFDFFLV